MPTQYTPTLRLALPVQGELDGTWGDVVNNEITSQVEQAIAGAAIINSWTSNSNTLTVNNGTSSTSRCAMLIANSNAGQPSAAATIITPNTTKLYVVRNNTGQVLTVKTAAGTGVAIPTGNAAFVFCDGTNVLPCETSFTTVTVAGNASVGNLLVGTTVGSNRLDIRGLNTAPTLTVNEGSTNSMVSLIEEDSALGAGAQILFGSRYSGVSTVQGAAIKSSKEVSAGDGGDQYNHSLVFKTSSFPSGLQEKARITSSGYLKVSNTGNYQNAAAATHEFSNSANNYVLIANSTNTGSGAITYLSLMPSGATAYHFQALTNLSPVFVVLANGNVQNTNNSYGAISDRKLKQNITPAKSILAKLRKVNWVNYELISNPKLKQFGVIAQELEELFPSLIERSKDTREVTKTVTKTRTIPAVLDDEGNITEPERIEEYTEEVTEREETGEETLAVKYSVLYMLTAKALQEAMDIVDKQGAMLEALEARVIALEQRQ